MSIEQYKNGKREIGGGKSKERGKEGEEREREVGGGRGESIMYTCIPPFILSIHYSLSLFKRELFLPVW